MRFRRFLSPRLLGDINAVRRGGLSRRIERCVVAIGVTESHITKAEGG